MTLQEQIAEAIIIAFDELGGQPVGAVEAARRHHSVDAWVQQESAKIAIAGGAEMAIPGLHALTIPAGISYLLHKMATICWGIGSLKGAYVIEHDMYSDLRNILALWGNESYFNPHYLDHLAIDVDLFQHALTDEGFEQITALVKDEDAFADDKIMRDSLTALHIVAGEFAGNESAAQMLRIMGKYSLDIEQVINRARPRKLIIAVDGDINAPGARLSSKLALRLAARISMRVPARLVMGFVPFAGAIVNAFFNAQTLRSIADTAEKYYDRRLTLEMVENART